MDCKEIELTHVAWSGFFVLFGYTLKIKRLNHGSMVGLMFLGYVKMPDIGFALSSIPEADDSACTRAIHYAV